MLHRENLVWLKYERVFAEIVEMGAYYSTVRFVKAGLQWEVQVENDEFEVIDD